ncbi:MAG: regulatory signaling modulator protein AmpE [Gammaproteobacteria bacterium]|nr:regulatory signaling modulator protein AmpE [Gammaproteobacteria bacterium]
MNLLIIVAALLVGQFMQWPERWRDFTWYLQHLDWLGARVDLRGAWGLLLALALPVLSVLLLQALLARGPGLVLGTAFAWLVLLCCLGPGHLLATINEYLQALHAEDEEQTAVLRAQLEDGRHEDQDPIAVGIVSRAHDEYFAVLFWFAILGPVGAVLYRFTRLIAQLDSAHENLRPAAEHLLGVLGWPSTRLAAFGFALMGNFDKALFKLTGGLAWQTDLLAANRGMLAEVTCAAVDFHPHDTPTDVARRARDLIVRTLTLWLVVFAVLTLLGW